MYPSSRTMLRLSLIFLLACVPAFAQRGGGGGHSSGSRGGARYFGGGGSYGGYGGYSGYGYSGLYGSAPSPQDVPQNYWWVSPYPSENPCQAGCNPNAGYEWSSVGALILETNPPKARITLDGIYAGTTDKLGPFQLPMGEHTLHIEAAGFESSDIVVKFDQPGVQNLNIQLKRLVASAKPAPRS